MSLYAQTEVLGRRSGVRFRATRYKTLSLPVPSSFVKWRGSKKETKKHTLRVGWVGEQTKCDDKKFNIGSPVSPFWGNVLVWYPKPLGLVTAHGRWMESSLCQKINKSGGTRRAKEKSNNMKLNTWKRERIAMAWKTERNADAEIFTGVLSVSVELGRRASACYVTCRRGTGKCQQFVLKARQGHGSGSESAHSDDVTRQRPPHPAVI